MFEVLQEDWAVRALLASIIIGVLCGTLGVFVVLRNMSLLGDALSHAVLPGVVLGFVVFGAASAVGIFGGAVLAGLVMAGLITWIQKKVSTKPDAAIGIVFSAMFSLGVIGISYLSKKEGVHLDLKDYLFGNILGVSYADLWLSFGITIYALFSVLVFYRFFLISSFQPTVAKAMGINTDLLHYFFLLLLSLAVVTSLQTVGVILVVSLLVVPASTALLLSYRLHWVLLYSALIGVASSITGFFVAVGLECPPGPAIALSAFFYYLLAVFFSPQNGLVINWFRQRKSKNKIDLEDVLKQALKLHESGKFETQKLVQLLQLPTSTINQQLSLLQKRGFLVRDMNFISLTPKGEKAAKRLVRAHRLWETFLVTKLGLGLNQIHEDAEVHEHLLTDELLNEIESMLDYPELDPHGSPIPKN